MGSLDPDREKIVKMRSYFVTLVLLWMVYCAKGLNMDNFPPSSRNQEEMLYKRSRMRFSSQYPRDPELLKRVFCIQPNWSCQTNTATCCEGFTCRCNLFGTNCRCQRMGIFQRFG